MRYIYFILFVCFTPSAACAQHTAKESDSGRPIFDTTRKINLIKQIKADTAYQSKMGQKDTLALKKKHNPHLATLRSAILPGWGQAYNREYWKIPLVYAAIGIPVAIFIDKNTWYKRARDAYTIVATGQTQNYNQINTQLIDVKTGLPYDASTLQFYRNNLRKDRDYSALAILFAWGLNVIDATVFGHLKNFDVSSDLSMRVQPNYDPTFKTTSLGFVFNFKPKQHKEALIF